MSKAYFATGYVRLLYRFACSRRLPPVQLLRGTGCSEADLMRADYEMPFSAQMRFCENALARSGPGLGLQVGDQLQLAAHGALGTAMQSAPDLKTALATFVQCIAMRASFFGLSMSEQRESARMAITVRDLPAGLIPFFSESILLALTHCLTFYTGNKQAVRQVQLAFARPTYAADYVAAFGNSVEFGCSTTQVTFDRSLLSTPSPEADADYFELSVRRCHAQIAQRRVDVDARSSVESFLLENPGRLWTLEEVAPLFAVSSRTLIRRLQSCGTTYQALRDEALQRQAATYLATMSVESTAVALGFSDTSSFRRTFRRWFGLTPSEFLRRS